MSSAVALLRGMNVGGHRITNDDLVAIVKSLGLIDVTAYQASGNVLFRLGDQAAGDVEGLLEKGLAVALGYSVPTTVRTATEIQSVLKVEPYASARNPPAGKPQIIFFKNPPSSRQRVEIEALAPSGDHLVVIGREAHWWPDGGLSDSAIDWAGADRDFGPLTMRTRNTIERIAKKFITTS